MRIAKYIANSGFCSRREAEKLIEQGLVTLNDAKVTEFFTKVEGGDFVKVRGKKIHLPTKTRMWLFNKPKGVICSRSDELGRRTIYDLIPRDLQNIHYIGRLDFNSEGLLLLTNSAEVKQFYEDPKNALDRVYLVKVYGAINEKIYTQPVKGLKSKDPKTGRFQILKAKVEAEKISTDSKNHWLKFTLKQGKNREVRRICEHYDLKVSKLKRLSFGKFSLSNLPSGDIIEH